MEFSLGFLESILEIFEFTLNIFEFSLDLLEFSLMCPSKRCQFAYLFLVLEIGPMLESGHPGFKRFDGKRPLFDGKRPPHLYEGV